MKGKKTLATIIIGGALYNIAKGAIFGRPPSKVRKTIIYTLLAGTLIYNSCQDELVSTKNYLESSASKVVEFVEAKNNKELELIKANNDKELQLIYQKTNSLENKLDVLVKKNDDLTKKLETSEYNSKSKVTNNDNDNNDVTSLRGSRVTIRDANYRSNNRHFANRSNHDPKAYWFVARDYESSKSLARLFTHNDSYAEKILQINNISDNDLAKGFPVIIPIDYVARNEFNLRSDYVPVNIAIKQNESLDEFVIRIKNPPTITQRRRYINEIKKYNASKGNNLNSHANHLKSYVYLPNGW